MTWKYHVDICSYIAQTESSEATETVWCCNRRSTYVLQVCHCTNHGICLSCMTHKSNQERHCNTKNIQKGAMSVILPGINYHEALNIFKLPILSIRRYIKK